MLLNKDLTNPKLNTNVIAREKSTATLNASIIVDLANACYQK
jgi:hypothetical protein